jgi:hypothetical protein
MAELPRFGASDFYLIQTDPLELREQLRSALSELLSREVVDADPHMVLASAFMPFLVQGQASADAAAKATLRAFAVGADLDRIADSTCVVGYMDRLPARGAILAALVLVTVTRPAYIDAGAVTITCSAAKETEVDGLGITFSGAGAYTIAFSATEEAKQLALPIYMIASVPGAQYNGLFRPQTQQPVLDADISVDISAKDETGADCTCDNISALRCGSTYNGADIESDDAFARRVAWQAKALRVPGSLEYFLLLLSQIRLLASSYVSPKVDSEGRIVMAWCDKAAYYAEQGGYSLSAKGAAYDEFREAVQSSLLVEQRVMAYPAKQYSNAYAVSYKLPSSTTDIYTARSAVEAAWRLYLSARTWHCGAVLNVAEMNAVMTNAGATQVEVTSNAPDYLALPADTMIPDHLISLSYAGLSVDEAAPAGSDGEEITP